jgi:hypothetical protein
MHKSFEVQTQIEFTPTQTECAGLVIFQSHEYNFQFVITKNFLRVIEGKKIISETPIKLVNRNIFVIPGLTRELSCEIAGQARNDDEHVSFREHNRGGLRGKFTLIAARLETGRTHQIRVHMAHIGHPVLGDIVYGAARQPFGLNGQVLHAVNLKFTHPSSGEEMEFNSPLPKYFSEIINLLQ